MCGLCVDAGVGSVEVSIEPPGSAEQLKASVNQQSDVVYLVEYTPLVTGPHTVNVYYSGEHVNYSPFTTRVKPRQYTHTRSLSVCLSVCMCMYTWSISSSDLS